MRIFIAFEIISDVREYLYHIRKKLINDYNKIKWVEKDNIHLTLKFIGEVPDEKVERIARILEPLSFSSINASISDIGFFPHKGNPRVLWIGIEPSQGINKIHRDIDILLKREGIPGDDRFKSHLTLGRIKEIKDKDKFFESVNHSRDKLEKRKFILSRICLKKSTLTHSGPVYEDISVIDAKNGLSE